MKSTITLSTHNNVRYLSTKFFSYDVTGKFVTVDVRRSLVTINGQTFKIATNGALVK